VTHNDSDFLAMYHERRTDQEQAAEFSTRPRLTRTKRRGHTLPRHAAAVLGLVLTVTGRTLERLGEHLAKPEERFPRECT